MDETSTAELGAIPEHPSLDKLHKVIEEIRARAKSNPDGFFNSGTTYFYVKRPAPSGHGMIDWPESTYDPMKRLCYNFLTGVYPMRYIPDKPKTEQLLSMVKDPNRNRSLQNNLKTLANIENPGAGGGFFWAFSKQSKLPEGIHGDHGRIYLNLLPQQGHRVFWELARLLNDTQIPFQLKMLDYDGSQDILNLNRADKMVLYFDVAHQADVLTTVRNLYETARPASFEEATPKLAARLKDKNGSLMKGVAFGQDPDESIDGTEISFNNLREGIINSVHNIYHVPIDSTDFELKARGEFREFKIDPQNPAFNYPPENGIKLFALMAANGA